MVAKGFGGKYFSLTAITATVSQVRLHRIATVARPRLVLPLFFCTEEDDPPPDELFSDKPCYCNIFFACLAHKVLRLARIKKPPLCRCRKTKSGIAPPRSFF